MNRRKVGPYPRRGSLADKAEWVLQRCLGWMAVYDPDHPMLSGAATGILVVVAAHAIIALVAAGAWLIGHWR
jgi:hypothetical protein